MAKNKTKTHEDLQINLIDRDEFIDGKFIGTIDIELIKRKSWK